MNEPFIWLALGAAFISAYLASCHQAFHFFSDMRMENMLKKSGRSWLYEHLIERRAGFMWMTATLRSTLNLLVIVSFLAVFREELTGTGIRGFWWPLGKSMLISGAIILTIGVAIPSSLGRYAPEIILIYSYHILKGLYVLCYPIMVFFNGLDWVTRRLIGWQPPDEDEPTAVEQEILDAVAEGERMGQVDEAQKERIEAVMDFPTINTGEIMTPRTDICGVSVEMPLSELKCFVAEKGHSRFPVYETDLDNIIGMLYVKDLLKYIGDAGQDFNIRDLSRPVFMVPGSKPVNILLEEFRANKVHVAIVLDEFGGTAGMVTVEDIIEEIVGDIHDEHEVVKKDPRIIIKSEGLYLIDARVHIDDVNDELEISLPDNDDYETIGGFVFSSLGHVPEAGEYFDLDGLRITVIDAERTHVNRVKIEVLVDEELNKVA